MKCAFGTLPICGFCRKSRLIQSPTRLWRYKTLLKRFMGDWYKPKLCDKILIILFQHSY